MREATGDLWDLVRDNGGVLVITTNGTVKKNGDGVMGRGVALEAKRRFPTIEATLGEQLRANGNHVEVLAMWLPSPVMSMHQPILRFPVKHNWYEKADPDLIVRSAHETVALADEHLWSQVWVPRPGCGNGGLRWEDVKPLLDPILDDRFIAVTNG